jgi:hypothetical protein
MGGNMPPADEQLGGKGPLANCRPLIQKNLGAILPLLLFLAGVLWLGVPVRRAMLTLERQESQIALLREQVRVLAAAGQAAPRQSEAPAPVPVSPPAGDPAKGAILEPRPRQEVAASFACTVRVDQPHPEHHYYLVLRRGGQCWPRQEVKMPPGGATTAWEISQEGIPCQGPLCLELREVGREQHRAIAQWQQGQAGQPLEPPGWLLDAIQLN